jgi:hypothetical protein
MVHLVGQLSNPSAALERVLVIAPPLETIELPPARSLPSRRLGNGVVQRATTQVLRAADRPMRVADICRAVGVVLGHTVSYDSVSWCLRMVSRGDELRFERVSYYYYRLKRL